MRAIVELTDKEYEEMSNIYTDVREKLKLVEYKDRFEINNHYSGYAHYKFEVKPTQKLLDAFNGKIAPNQMIMIVDSGFSHFGASCNINNDGIYSGRVNTD